MEEPVPPQALVQALAKARRIAVLTGAGVSAESGVPTFRDAATGLWARYDPHELATPEAFARDPALVWDWYAWRHALVARAEPNAAHRALALAEAQSEHFTLVTQNVDGLHRRAGSRRLVELHGTLTRARCTGCAARYPFPPPPHPPHCPRCDALLRPDVVWFGEAVPAEALDTARAAAASCEVLLVVGTSARVEPAASLARVALAAGAVVAEINPEATPLSAHAHHVLRGPAAGVLPRLIAAAFPGLAPALEDDAARLRRLIDLMARLRDPERGCPWDRAQTFATIAPYTIEEAYEVADAIARGDLGALREELGDLLFQVVFHARMAEEQGAFDLRAVIDGLVAKMRRRHPHVFGDASVDDAAAQSRHWEAIKAAERGAADSALDGIALALPALVRAAKVQRRAARVGFDWDAPEAVLEKVREETAELAAELAARDRARLADELGDLLFAAVNLARHLGVDAEDALRRATARFEARFRTMERLAAARGTALAALDAEALEALWAEAKAAEAARS